LRGELSRWLVEPRSGVFVGNTSAMVRDKLWEMVCSRLRRAAKLDGGAIMLWSTNNEQGFAIKTYGRTDRQLVDYDGLMLVLKPAPAAVEDRER